MECLVPFQQEGSRDPGRQWRLAACAGPLGRHLQFRRRADGGVDPQHLHPSLGCGEDRLYRPAGECDRADHDRKGRAGLGPDNLLSLLFCFGFWPRHGAATGDELAGIRDDACQGYGLCGRLGCAQ
ncbi:hypothetical protein D3C87_1663450 [compost metagenome]